MLAHAVALPVLERLERGGQAARVLGAHATAAYLELDRWVVAVTARGAPLMPNGVALTGVPERWPTAGARVALEPGGLRARGWRVVWDPGDPPVWNPRVPSLEGVAPAALRARGLAILGTRPPAVASGAPGVPVVADRALAAAASEAVAALLGTGDPTRAAAPLLGRGPGLTPEGDDLVAGVAACVVAIEGAAGAARARTWLPADLVSHTTPLSATLLALAAEGYVLEPVGALLHPDRPAWRGALRRLERIGHSTGPAYAAAVGAALVWLSALR